MPRTCGICSHERLTEINSELVKQQPLRVLAKRFETSAGALLRHKRKHLPVALSVAKQAAQVAEGESLLEQVRSLHTRTLDILARAEAAGQLETALKAIRESRNNLELLARLDGELKDRARDGQVSITVNYIDRPALPGVERPAIDASAIPLLETKDL